MIVGGEREEGERGKISRDGRPFIRDKGASISIGFSGRNDALTIEGEGKFFATFQYSFHKILVLVRGI